MKLVIEDDDGNRGVFEPDGSIYTGHYEFKARGREAIEVAKEMLSLVFSKTDAEAIRGMIPLTNLGSRWITRQLGFTSHGVLESPEGPVELFILTKDH